VPPAGPETAQLLTAIRRLRARIRAETFPDTDRTPAQLTLLAAIVDRGPVTAQQLAAAEHVRPQTIGETVRALIDAGLVGSARDEHDRRRHQLTATAAGVELIGVTRHTREAWLAAAIARLPARQQREVARTIALLEDLADTPGPGRPARTARPARPARPARRPPP
jgi:DNA-binding MarR family transcriptional regulator